MMDNEGIFEAGKMRKKIISEWKLKFAETEQFGSNLKWALSLSPRVIALEPSMEEGKPEVTKKNMH